MVNFSKLSHFISSASPLFFPAEVVDGYRFSEADDSSLDWREMADTMHCLAMA